MSISSASPDARSYRRYRRYRRYRPSFYSPRVYRTPAASTSEADYTTLIVLGIFFFLILIVVLAVVFAEPEKKEVEQRPEKPDSSPPNDAPETFASLAALSKSPPPDSCESPLTPTTQENETSNPLQ